jgi:hypothetical protein
MFHGYNGHSVARHRSRWETTIRASEATAEGSMISPLRLRELILQPVPLQDELFERLFALL